MSQTPSEEVEAEQVPEYVAGIHRVASMVQSGMSHSGRERNRCFLNTGGERFANASAVSGLNFVDDARGIGVVDWDHDGDLDLWISNRTAPQLRFLRNDTSRENHYLAVHLVGKRSNRDGIGARVEVHLAYPQGRKLIKTVHAGDGFLSQSSKWAHFGLGRTPRIEQLLVRWPSGGVEEFRGVTADARFLLIEGTGLAKPWKLQRRVKKLEPSVIEAPRPPDRSRIWLSARVALPGIQFDDRDGHEVDLTQFAARPVLLNFWASWCKPCLKELQDITVGEDELRAAGLEVIALNVDGLTDGGASESGDGAKRLKSLSFPFRRGTARAENIDKLQLLYFALFGREIKLPVPASFLIDANGALAVIYLGPVDLNHVLTDVANLNVGPKMVWKLGDTLPGRWSSPARLARIGGIARIFDGAGYVEDAIPMYRRSLEFDPSHVEHHRRLGLALARSRDSKGAESSYRQALRLNPKSVQSRYAMAVLLSERRKFAEAANEFREVLRMEPGHAGAHYNLGVALMQGDDVATAIDHYRLALKIEPDNVEMHNSLGVALARRSAYAEARRHYRRALQINPRNANVHYNLASALSQDGQPHEAIKHYRSALRIKPAWPLAVSAVAWVLATSRDPNLRDAAEAVRLAEQSSRATQDRVPEMLDTLAAAYASAGRFDEAVQTVSQAIALASAAEPRADELVQQLRRHRDLYEADRPLRSDQ